MPARGSICDDDDLGAEGAVRRTSEAAPCRNANESNYADRPRCQNERQKDRGATAVLIGSRHCCIRLWSMTVLGGAGRAPRLEETGEMPGCEAMRLTQPGAVPGTSCASRRVRPASVGCAQRSSWSAAVWDVHGWMRGNGAPVSIPSPYCPWPMLIAQGVVHARPSPMPAVPVVQKMGHCCVSTRYACEDSPAASP